MLQEFPNITETQVALMRADINTGIVLDEENSYAIDSLQKVYTIFDNQEHALQFAKELIENNHGIECYIYGPYEKLQCFIDYQNIDIY